MAAFRAQRLEGGAVVWRTYTVPEGYSGGAVWGSTLVVDMKRQSLYVPTGNNYRRGPAGRGAA